MLEPIVTAGSISGFVSLVGLLYVIFTKLGKMEVKICTLWKIYGEDVLRRAVQEGLGRSSSRIRITEKGEELLGEDMKQKIETIVERRNNKPLWSISPVKDDDLIYFVLNETIEDLKRRAGETDVDINSLVATTILYTEKILGNSQKK